MDMYPHDSATTFRFVLRGELIDDYVAGLRHAWTTAQSILGPKELVVDLSGITTADAAGFEMLSEMRHAGARLTGRPSPASTEFLISLGVPAVAPACRRANVIVRLAHTIADCWLSRAQGGAIVLSEETVIALLTPNLKPLRIFSQRQLRVSSSAYDIVQETLLRAFTRRSP